MPRPKKKVAVEEVTTKKPTPRRGRPKKVEGGFNFANYFSSIRSNVVSNQVKYRRYLIGLVLVVVLGVLVFVNKQWFVVAVINRQPVSTVEFYQALKAKDGQTVLDQLIRDKLITQEATKRNIKISQTDIDNKVKDVQSQLGGADQLKQALAQSSLTENDFREQVKIQLMVEKMLGDKLNVTDKEITDYITANPSDPNVTGSDGKGPDKDAIRKQLQSNKLNDNFQSWYDALQKQSSILKFI